MTRGHVHILVLMYMTNFFLKCKKNIIVGNHFSQPCLSESVDMHRPCTAREVLDRRCEFSKTKLLQLRLTAL